MKTHYKYLVINVSRGKSGSVDKLAPNDAVTNNTLKPLVEARNM
jgi:hypothetical protein